MSVELLARAAVFAGLGPDDLARVAGLLEPHALAAGGELFAEGSAPDALYVVAEGELAITKRVGDSGDTLINVCGPGEVLGEMSLLEALPRSATARATRPSRVLRLGADAFDQLVRSSPSMALAILKVVTTRLRNTEAVLRQFDKLTALGRIAAGIAHELDNPAAALGRGASVLDDTAVALREVAIELAGAGLGAGAVQALAEAASGLGPRAPGLGPLERSEREGELERMLADKGVHDPWSIAPALVAAGWTPERLDALAAVLGPAARAGLRWLGLHAAAGEIVGELRAGARRISTIVASVRTYSHLGEAPVTRVDVREGVETAITLLAHKLRGFTVSRAFAPDVPEIEAHGGELNQVWTNLIDNAIDAAGPSGAIRVAAERTPRGVAVTITDDGPGIPPAVLPRLFEPFFTTKPPGAGTGLGLHIAYDVVVRKHRGQIDVDSRPGHTAFRVELPLRPGGQEVA
jgi:signal transduction histidine kinase